MTFASPQARVLSLVATQLSLSEDDIRPEQRLAEDLGADVLDIMEIVMEIEEQFSIEISDEDVEKILTVQDFLDCISKSTLPQK